MDCKSRTQLSDFQFHFTSHSPFPLKNLSPRQSTTCLLSISINLPLLDVSCKENHTAGGPLWLTSFSYHNVFKVCHALHYHVLHSFHPQIIFPFRNMPYFVYPQSDDRRLGWFSFLAIMSNGTNCTKWYKWVQIFVGKYVLISPGNTPGCGISGSHGNFTSKLLRNYQTWFKAASPFYRGVS